MHWGLGVQPGRRAEVREGRRLGEGLSPSRSQSCQSPQGPLWAHDPHIQGSGQAAGPPSRCLPMPVPASGRLLLTSSDRGLCTWGVMLRLPLQGDSFPLGLLGVREPACPQP